MSLPLIAAPGSLLRIREKLLSWEAWQRWISRQYETWKYWPQIQLLQRRVQRENDAVKGMYPSLSAEQVGKMAKTNTLFIFGSGPSIQHLSDEEIDNFKRSDRMGFNWFCENARVPLNYYLIKEISMNKPYLTDRKTWDGHLTRYAELLKVSTEKNALLLVQGGIRSLDGNHLMGLQVLPRDRSFFRFKVLARSRYEPPSESLDRGLVHGHTSLLECINFGYLRRWSRIVLVGVDLRTTQYFWPRPDTEVNGAADHPHPTGELLVFYLKRWLPYFKAQNIQLEVYNPKSLLADILPVFKRPALQGIR